MTRLHHFVKCPFIVAIAIQGAIALAEEGASGHLRPENARLLIIAGHPGDDEHSKIWHRVADRLRACFRDRLGVAESRIEEWRGEEHQKAEATHHGAATYARLRTDIAELALQTNEDDELWVILLAHTNGSGRSTFLNLPGPDITTDEFSKLFLPIKCRRKVFVLATPLSGSFCSTLSHGSHILVAAAAEDEPNATYFAESFIEVLNETCDSIASPFREVSLLQLVEATSRKIEARYATAGFIVTEHIQIDDNGDKRATELELAQEDELVVRPKLQGKVDGDVIAKVFLKFTSAK